jgi:hypothetical protein
MLYKIRLNWHPEGKTNGRQTLSLLPQCGGMLGLMVKKWRAVWLMAIQTTGNILKQRIFFLPLLTASAEPTAGMVVDCLKALRRVKRNDEAKTIIGNYRLAFVENPAFIKAWAEFALATKDEEFLFALTTLEFIELLEKSNSPLPFALLYAVDRDKEADQRAISHLMHRDFSKGHFHEIVELADRLNGHGKWHLVEKYIHPQLSEERWEELENDLTMRSLEP